MGYAPCVTPLLAHLKAMDEVLSPGDLARVIATTPETVSRLRGGRPARRANEVAILTLRAVIDELRSGGAEPAEARDALLSRLCAPDGTRLTEALRAGDAGLALATLGVGTPPPGPDADDLAADLAFDARMADAEQRVPTGVRPEQPRSPVPARLTAARDAVRAAFMQFEPAAEIEESVNPGDRPDDEQVLLAVSIPGLARHDVRERVADFREARWHDLLDEIDGDVVVVTR
jgi:hypothetical protein